MKLIVLLIFLIMSCSPLVCRHIVLSHTGWAIEQGMDYKIVVYEVSPAWSLGIYNGHTQVRTDKGWISDYMGYPIISDGPTFTPTGWIKEYDIDEYIALMGRNCFNNADCSDVGIP